MRVNILFGGKAGQGPNILSHIVAEALVEMGYYVFYSRDYQSLIRGVHNFNVLSFSESPISSNDEKIDILVSMDKETEKIHKNSMKKNSIILDGEYGNMYFAGSLFKILNFDFSILEKSLKKIEKNFNENIKEAKKGYENENRMFSKPHLQGIYKASSKNEKNKVKIQVNSKEKKTYLINGSQGISKGAVKSGLDIYYAYPMTPATPVLMELAQRQEKDNILILELENEIAVINSAIGSAMTGAKAMVGTSGGGFDLMTEGLSLSGIAEVPIVVYLSQRPGPATGVPTYTSQGDLNLARHCGHGEFPRVVFAPGDPIESQELISQAFYFSQKYKIPVIFLGDKHLAESFYTIDKTPRITKSEKSTSMKRYNSYEKDSETHSATEDKSIIKENVEERLKKAREIEKEAEKFEQYKIFGDESSKNLIVSWGSTKGAILDSIKDSDFKFMQVMYMEPFSKQIEKELGKAENIILIENNSTGQLGNLISEKTGIFIDDKNKILKYDGRPFLCDELKEKITMRINR